MVTFNTEYWAPALDNRSRRRATESEERVARVTRERISTNVTSTLKKHKELPVVDITDPNKSPFNNDYNKSSNSNSNPSIPTTEMHALNVSDHTNSNTPSTNNNVNIITSIDSNSLVGTTTIVPNPKVDGSLNLQKFPPKDVLHHHDSHKRLSFVQKLFHHESKDHLVTSPVEEKGEFIFSNSTPDKLSTLKVILNPTLDLDDLKQIHRSDSGNDNELIDSESLIKKYGICEKGCIGKGATAVVRLAHKLDKSETTFAIKEFRKRRKNETEKEYVKKLASEFCISSALQHINIVRTVDLIQDENHNWCEVMEYCAGGDLYTAIKSNHMTMVEINCCFKQLIMGVDYLHNMGVAHRDIKPENLLLDAKGHLKITDFGVSDVFRTCWQEAAHKSSGLCGSEPYISPEQFETKEYDARLVDVWACGIVYYTMLYQGMPFRMAIPTDPNYANYLETRNTGEYEPFEKLPSGCKELMYKILEPDAKKRIVTSKIKQDVWFKSIESCSDTPRKLKKLHNHISPELLKEIQNGNATMGTNLVNNRMIEDKNGENK